MRIFLDTDVLLDFFDSNRPGHEDAKRLQVMEVTGDAELWTSAQAVVDASRVLESTCPPEQTQQMVLELCSFIKLTAVDMPEVRAAARYAWPKFERALADLCANKVKADVILTYAVDDYEESQLLAAAPNEFFEELQEADITFDDLDW